MSVCQLYLLFAGSERSSAHSTLKIQDKLPRSGFYKPAHDAVVALHSAFDFLFSAARFVKKCHNSDAVWSARSTTTQHVDAQGEVAPNQR